MSSIRLQEIMTRAVVGRCDRRVVWSHSSPADGVENVLGVHVSKAELTVEEGDSGAAVRLSAVCEVWCSAGGETQVERLTCTHIEPADVPLTARAVGRTETSGRLVRGVRCIEAEVRDGLIQLTLESHIALESSGLARFWIRAYDLMADAELDEGLDSLGSSTSDSSGSSSAAVAALDQEPDAEMATLAASPELPEPAAREVRKSTVMSRFPRQHTTARLSIVQG